MFPNKYLFSKTLEYNFKKKITKLITQPHLTSFIGFLEWLACFFGVGEAFLFLLAHSHFLSVCVSLALLALWAGLTGKILELKTHWLLRSISFYLGYNYVLQNSFSLSAPLSYW